MPQLKKVSAKEQKSGSPTFRLGYQRGLDGLRGVAILLVLLNHGEIIGDGFGFVAVNTFFVLSGFLITSLLVGEWDKHGDISLRHFYARRALRLLPALLAMLTLFVLFVFLTDPYKRAVREFHEALRALFYMTNWAKIFHWGRNLSLAHAWSLSIEEQFYFVWPVLLLFLLQRNTRPSLLCWISLGIALSILARVACSILGQEQIGESVLPADPNRMLMGLDTRADSLLLGCLGAVLVSSELLPKQPWFLNGLRWFALASVGTLTVLSLCRTTSAWMIHVGWLGASVGAMGLIVHLVTGSRGSLHRLLESSGLVYVGTISYGLYVWHFPILKAMQQHKLPWQHMAYMIPVLAVVLLSYYFVERPFLRLKKRFSRGE